MARCDELWLLSRSPCQVVVVRVAVQSIGMAPEMRGVGTQRSPSIGTTPVHTEAKCALALIAFCISQTCFWMKVFWHNCGIWRLGACKFLHAGSHLPKPSTYIIHLSFFAVASKGVGGQPARASVASQQRGRRPASKGASGQPAQGSAHVYNIKYINHLTFQISKHVATGPSQDP